MVHCIRTVSIPIERAVNPSLNLTSLISDLNNCIHAEDLLTFSGL